MNKHNPLKITNWQIRHLYDSIYYYNIITTPYSSMILLEPNTDLSIAGTRKSWVKDGHSP